MAKFYKRMEYPWLIIVIMLLIYENIIMLLIMLLIYWLIIVIMLLIMLLIYENIIVIMLLIMLLINWLIIVIMLLIMFLINWLIIVIMLLIYWLIIFIVLLIMLLTYRLIIVIMLLLLPCSTDNIRKEMGEPRSIAIYETVYGQYDRICWGKIDLENIMGFQSLVREIDCMVREASGKVTKEYKNHIVSALDPLFEFNVNYMDLDDNSINIMTTPWAFFRSRIDEIGITRKYDVLVGMEIPIEGIDQIMKLDIGAIEDFFSFYRALQFLGSAYTNTDPEDHFTSEEPWEGYSLYLLSDQNIIVTPHWVWRSAGQLWEERKLLEFDTATVASSMDSNNEEDELMVVNAEIDDASSVVAGIDDASSMDDDASEMAGNIAGVDNGSLTDDDDSESAGNVLVSGIGFSSSEEDEGDDFLQWETKHVTKWGEVKEMLTRIVVKPKLLIG